MILGLAVLLMGQAQPQRVEIMSDTTGDLRLLAASSGNPHIGVDTVTGEGKFSMTGEPVIQKNSSGFELTAHQVSGTYSTQPDKTYQLDSFHADGSAVVRVDSSISAKFNKTAPSTSSVTILHSETLDGNQKNEIAHLVLKSPFQIDDDEISLPSQGPTERVSIMTASSGAFQFSAPKMPGKAKLLNGEAFGPCHIHSVEKVKAKSWFWVMGHAIPFLQPLERVYDVVGDHLTIDMSKPKNQIVLNGNVKYSMTTDGAHGTADRVSLTVDENWKVTYIETDGAGNGSAQL